MRDERACPLSYPPVELSSERFILSSQPQGHGKGKKMCLRDRGLRHAQPAQSIMKEYIIFFKFSARVVQSPEDNNESQYYFLHRAWNAPCSSDEVRKGKTTRQIFATRSVVTV